MKIIIKLFSLIGLCFILAQSNLTVLADETAADKFQVTLQEHENSQAGAESVLVTVKNIGSSPAKDVTLEMSLPDIFKVNNSDQLSRHIGELDVNASKSFQLTRTAVPISIANQNLPKTNTRQQPIIAVVGWILVSVILYLIFKQVKAKQTTLFIALLVSIVTGVVVKAADIERHQDESKTLEVSLAGKAYVFSCLASGVFDKTEEPPAEPVETTISLLHVNDVHGYVAEENASIGYGKVETFFKTVKAENPNTLVLDAGDTFQGCDYASFNQAESLVKILNTMSFDVAALGNNDTSFGLERLKAIQRDLKYPILAGNVTDSTNQPLFEGTKIFTLPNGKTVGIFSVTTNSTQAAGLVNHTEIEAISAKLVAELKIANVDTIVGLLHVGEVGEPSSVTIAKNVPGIDVIIDGHSHKVYQEPEIVNGTLVTQAGEWSKYVGRVDLTFLGDQLTAKKARLYDKTELSKLEPDVTTQAAVDDLKTLYAKDIDVTEVIGSTTVVLDGEREQVRTKETNLGNLASDAVLAKTDADLALVRGSAIRASIPVGTITVQNILDVVGGDTDFITKDVTGAQILEMMQACYAPDPFPAINGYFLQIGGGTYTLSSTGEILNLKIAGVPVNPAKTYTLAYDVALENFLTGVSAKDVPSVEWGKFKFILINFIKQHSPINSDTDMTPRITRLTN